MKGYVTIEEGCVAPAEKAKPLVSVIVPVYNVERYLDQALDSLEAQTLRNIEIICVNDGSTDGSYAIMRAHARSDERIRVIDKPNGGYGHSCNRGIDEARGRWIAILEPDDWLDPDAFKDMTDYAATFEGPIDIVKCPYWRIWMPDTKQQQRLNCSYYRRIKPASQPFTITDPGVVHILCHHPSIWSAIYRRDFLNEKNIRFHEIPGAGWADNPFLIDTLCQAQSIVYLNRAYYHYREETPEKTAAFAQRNTLLPMERWQDMADCLERLGVDDEGILRAHNSRGFTYLSGIIEEVDLSHQEVYDAALAMFDRMDDALVFGDPEISPGWKERYAEMKGLDCPPIDRMVHARGLVKAGLYNLVNVNPRNTLRITLDYLKKRRKREGR